MTNILYFEDIEPGSQTIGPSVTVDEREMLMFAEIWDPVPIHVDKEIAMKLMGGLTAPGLYILALKQRLIHQIECSPAVIASFGYDEVRFIKPVRGGDILTLVIDWQSKRLSKSRSDRGVVEHRLSLINQDSDLVMSHLDTMLVKVRPNV